MQTCHKGGLLVLGQPRQLVRLRYGFVSQTQLQRLQEHLLVRWPLMTATELAAGYNALNIDLNGDGVPLSRPELPCSRYTISSQLGTRDL